VAEDVLQPANLPDFPNHPKWGCQNQALEFGFFLPNGWPESGPARRLETTFLLAATILNAFGVNYFSFQCFTCIQFAKLQPLRSASDLIAIIPCVVLFRIDLEQWTLSGRRRPPTGELFEGLRRGQAPN
jgi:hypothetical protein